MQNIEDLVMELAPCPSLRKYHPECYEFFRELFQHHPDAERKKVSAIQDISLGAPGCILGRRNSYNRPASAERKSIPLDANGGPVFRIHYSKSKSDTISWRKCMK